MNAAYNGQWQKRGLIHIPIAPEAPGRPPKPIVGEWTDERLKTAHRRFNEGDRSLLVREGERVYQARRKRAQRAGHMSPVDRVWAEKNAVKGSWVLDTKNNRRASVSNTHLEKETTMNTTPDDGNTIPEEWELSETRQTNGATVMFYQPTDR